MKVRIKNINSSEIIGEYDIHVFPDFGGYKASENENIFHEAWMSAISEKDISEDEDKNNYKFEIIKEDL